MNPIPNPIVDLKFHQQSRELEVVFADAPAVRLSYEFLRVMSPSAEVRGHSPSQALVQTGCQQVGIEQVVSVGNYALQIFFDDGHHTGIYSWDFLTDLAKNKERHWRVYLDALMEQGKDRFAPMKPPMNKSVPH